MIINNDVFFRRIKLKSPLCSSCREFWFGDEPAGDGSFGPGQPEPPVFWAHPAAAPLSPWRPAAGRRRAARHRPQIHRGAGETAGGDPDDVTLSAPQSILTEEGVFVFSSTAAVWVEALWTTTPSVCVSGEMKLPLLFLLLSLSPPLPSASSGRSTLTSSLLRGNSAAVSRTVTSARVQKCFPKSEKAHKCVPRTGPVFYVQIQDAVFLLLAVSSASSIVWSLLQCCLTDRRICVTFMLLIHNIFSVFTKKQ